MSITKKLEKLGVKNIEVLAFHEPIQDEDILAYHFDLEDTHYLIEKVEETNTYTLYRDIPEAMEEIVFSTNWKWKLFEVLNLLVSGDKEQNNKQLESELNLKNSELLMVEKALTYYLICHGKKMSDKTYELGQELLFKIVAITTQSFEEKKEEE